MPVLKTLSFEIEKSDKAVLYITGEDGADISCMIDTGANVPIWFMGEDFLKLRYPSARKTDKLTIIHGLGKDPIVDVPIWNIPKFVIIDDNGENLIFHDMPMPVLNARQYSFNMLIPLTMLNRMRFTFDYFKSSVYAYFTIETDKTDYYIRSIYLPGNPVYLNRIQAFLQDE